MDDNKRDNPLLVGVKVMAKMLGISVRHLRNLTQEGMIPCIRLGGRVLYNPQRVLLTVESNYSNKLRGN